MARVRRPPPAPPRDLLENFLFQGALLPVSSSNVAVFQYDAQAEELTVGFKNGSVYRYAGVTLSEARQFYDASSKGGAVWDLLRVRGSAEGHKKSFTRLR